MTQSKSLQRVSAIITRSQWDHYRPVSGIITVKSVEHTVTPYKFSLGSQWIIRVMPFKLAQGS